VASALHNGEKGSWSDKTKGQTATDLGLSAKDLKEQPQVAAYTMGAAMVLVALGLSYLITRK